MRYPPPEQHSKQQHWTRKREHSENVRCPHGLPSCQQPNLKSNEDAARTKCEQQRRNRWTAVTSCHDDH